MRWFKLNPADTHDRNAWYLVIEIFWASMLAAAASFNAAFALRLGASNVEVGLLSSLPALVAVALSIPAGRFFQARTRRKPWILATLNAARLGYLLVALAPFLPLEGATLGLLVVLLVVATTIPGSIFNIGFIPMLADVISEERRASVFAARNIIYNASLSLCVFLFGLWLNATAAPLNYQVMYLFGFATSMVSTYYLAKVNMPDAPAAQAQTRRVTLRAFGQALRSHPAFLRITLNTLMHGVGVWLAAPLYILYYVRDLKAEEAWIGLQTTILSIATIVGFAFWRWLIRRWGEPRTLKFTIMLVGLIPLSVGLTNSLTVILFVVAFNGWLAGGVSLSHFNTLLKAMPADARPEYTALYTTFMNIGAFICPLIGVALANHFGYPAVLIACGVLVLAGSTSFLWNPVNVMEAPHAQPRSTDAA